MWLNLPLPRCRRGRMCSVRECVSSSRGYLCFDTKQLIPSEIHARRERSPCPAVFVESVRVDVVCVTVLGMRGRTMLLVLFLDFFTFSLLSYALTNLFVHVPQSYFPILPILNSLTCACIFVSTGYWKLIRETLFWTGDQCAATLRNGLNLTHHALPFSFSLTL